jgi:hypothetical protein
VGHVGALQSLIESLHPLWIRVSHGWSRCSARTDALFPFSGSLPDRLEKALGLTFRPEIWGASASVRPAKHFPYPMRAEMQSQVGQQIAAALDRSTG